MSHHEEEHVGLVEMGKLVDPTKTCVAVAQPNIVQQPTTNQVVVNVASDESGESVTAGVASFCCGEFGLCCMACCCNNPHGRFGAFVGFSTARLLAFVACIVLLILVASVHTRPSFSVYDEDACTAHQGSWYFAVCDCESAPGYVLRGDKCENMDTTVASILKGYYAGLAVYSALASLIGAGCAYYFYKRRNDAHTSVMVQQSQQPSQPAYPTAQFAQVHTSF